MILSWGIETTKFSSLMLQIISLGLISHPKYSKILEFKVFYLAWPFSVSVSTLVKHLAANLENFQNKSKHYLMKYQPNKFPTIHVNNEITISKDQNWQSFNHASIKSNEANDRDKQKFEPTIGRLGTNFWGPNRIVYLLTYIRSEQESAPFLFIRFE